MSAVRRLIPLLAGGALCASQLLAQGATATGTVSGRVVDATSQEPLPSVSVVVVGTRRGAITSNDGSFVIGGVPAGTQTLRASRIGLPDARPVIAAGSGFL